MSLLFPRLAYAPVRCSPVRREVAPLWSLFDDTLNELQRASRQTSRRQWNPRFDVKETKEAYSLEGELPGVDQKDINIEFVDEHTITIKGRHERRTEHGQRPTEAVEATEATTAAVEDGTATPASEHSAQSHHATVEDDVEEPANSSAATAAEQPAAQEVTKASTSAETETAKPAEPQFWFRERSVGEFTRSFSFPSRVDQEAVRASLKNGILSIVVPKAPVPESRRVTIE